MNFDGFIGPSYTTRGANFDCQRTVNLYLEVDETGKGKSPAALMGTPGLTTLQTLPTSPIRGIWTGLIDNLPGSSGSDLCYVVAGSKLYQITSSGTSYSLIGDVGDDASHSPVQFAVNGTQLVLSSAGNLWVWDNVTLQKPFFNNGTGTVNTAGTAVTLVTGDPFDATQVGSYIRINGVAYQIAAFIDTTHITLGSSAGTQTGKTFYVLTSGTSTPDYVTAAQVAFLDTYFIVIPSGGTKSYYISAPNDALNWSPLDYQRKAAFPDNIASILADHEELWLWGSETTEVHRNTGSADVVFQRDPGAFIHQGIRAPFTACSLANGVAWVGGDVRGNAIAWLSEGYTPRRISTHAVETQWAGYSTLVDAVAFVYTQDGHQFWVISFPTADATWVYDATSGQWHERGWWNGSAQSRVRYAYHGYVFGMHLVGDWQNGKLYSLDPTVYTDAGTAIHRMRTAPHISDEEKWSFYSRFRLANRGGGAPTLEWSDDLGATFNTARAASSRRISSGSTQLSEWRRLGRARDRVFRVEFSDAAQCVITGAYIDMSTGDG